MKQEIPTFFTPIPDSSVLLLTNGEYSEAPLYHRRHELFAKFGRNFIKLHPTLSNLGGTSKSKVSWKEIDLAEGSYEISQGQLIWSPVKARRKKAA